ncbi:MAG: hypothetical protein KAY27_01685 [Pedobacter sp.]|nr:hypothetical protein [Pedobacter sp.]
MISIIIASVKEDLLANVSQNIRDTIGVEFEIISFDNANGKYGLCELYNIGAQRAKFDHLCFMHEDIKMKTKDWGKVVLEHFSNCPKLGVLGVAGSTYKSSAPSGWGIGNEPNTELYNYLQSFKEENKPSIHAYLNRTKVKLQNVATVDGMWFCTTKKIALRHGFDEKLFRGFHCYDLDFCLNVGRAFDISVTFNILMEHFSEGGYNKQWFIETLKFQEKWQYMLPKSVATISNRTKRTIEKRAYLILFERLINLGFEKEYIRKFLKFDKRNTNMNLWLYIKLKYYLTRLCYKQ